MEFAEGPSSCLCPPTKAVGPFFCPEKEFEKGLGLSKTSSRYSSHMRQSKAEVERRKDRRFDRVDSLGEKRRVSRRLCLPARSGKKITKQPWGTVTPKLDRLHCLTTPCPDPSRGPGPPHRRVGRARARDRRLARLRVRTASRRWSRPSGRRCAAPRTKTPGCRTSSAPRAEAEKGVPEVVGRCVATDGCGRNSPRRLRRAGSCCSKLGSTRRRCRMLARCWLIPASRRDLGLARKIILC